MRQWTQAMSVFVILALVGVATAQPPPPPATVKVVCTAGYAPLTACSGDREPVGYEIEVFKRTVDRMRRVGDLSFAPGNWTWKCWESWDDMLTDIQKPASTRVCDVIVAGVSATAERQRNMQFSYATLSSGRRIMIHIDTDRGMWSFLEPFEPSLWVACFGTSAFVGLLLMLSECRLNGLWNEPRPALARAAGMQWGALGMLLRMTTQLSPRSTGGRLILAGYGFLVCIMANLYISSMSVILSSRGSAISIRTMEDLVNVPVGIFVDDKSAFQRFALNNVQYFPWANDDEERDMLKQLRSGRVKALILDSPWVKYMAAQYCDLFVAGDIVLPVDLGFAFPLTDTPIGRLQSFDSALGYLDDTGELVMLERQWLMPSNPCHSTQSSVIQDLSPQIQLKHVSGLWVFLAGCVGLCVLWNILMWLWRWLRARQRARAQGLSSKATSSSGAATPHASLPLGAVQRGADGAALQGKPATQDEALQALDAQLRQVDHLIRHMPFVMAATMDARLSDLKSQLLGSGGGGGGGGATPWQHQGQQKTALTTERGSNMPGGYVGVMNHSDVSLPAPPVSLAAPTASAIATASAVESLSLVAKAAALAGNGALATSSKGSLGGSFGGPAAPATPAEPGFPTPVSRKGVAGVAAAQAQTQV